MTTKPRLHHCLIFVAGWIPNTSYFSFSVTKIIFIFLLDHIFSPNNMVSKEDFTVYVLC